MFKSILCPVDFSDRSRGAAHAARAFAHRFGSEIVALHVSHSGDPVLLADLEARLNEFAERDFEGCRVSTSIVVGDTTERILQVAHDRRMELIVIATHGLSPFRRFELGSVASKILHCAPCPVWTGPHLEGWPALDIMPIHSILCALDFGQRSCTALHWASRLAGEFCAKLTLAHVIKPEEREHRFESPEATIRRQLERLQRPAEAVVVEGTPAARLSELAEEIDADLAVIGRTRASTAGLGANAYAIIAHSPCPVLSA